MKNSPKIIAHRGYSGIAPENTILSFTNAFLFGFDGIELDVHLTKDNQLVVIHDENTIRTSLVNKKIKNTNLNELKALDVAAYYQIKVPKQEILTLEEFMHLFYKRISYIDIELKTNNIWYQNIEKIANDLLIKYPDAYEKIFFCSFNFESLEKLHKINPKWKTGLLWSENGHEKIFKKIDPNKLKKVCTYLHPSIKAYKTHKKEYVKLKMPFNLWTIETKQQYDEFINEPNVLFLISDYKF